MRIWKKDISFLDFFIFLKKKKKKYIYNKLHSAFYLSVLIFFLNV